MTGPRDAKKFDVRFDPSRVTAQQLLEAVAKLKYRPSLDGSISAGVDTSAMAAEARTADAAHRSKSEGTIIISLSPKTNYVIGGEGLTPTKVEVVGTEKVTIPEDKAQVTVTDKLTTRELRVPFKVEKAPDGEQLVTVKVTFQSKLNNFNAREQTLEFKVPVVVR